jgi:hypothetical protein
LVPLGAKVTLADAGVALEDTGVVDVPVAAGTNEEWSRV